MAGLTYHLKKSKKAFLSAQAYDLHLIVNTKSTLKERRSSALYLDVLDQHFCNSIEKKLIHSLLKQHIHILQKEGCFSSRVETLDLKVLHLARSENVFECFKALAQRGCLFYQGKALELCIENKAQLHLIVEEHADGTFLLEGHLIYATNRWPLQQVCFLDAGRFFICIQGNKLYTLSPNLERYWVKKILKESGKILTQKQLCILEQELEEDGFCAPQYKKISLQSCITTPQAVLILQGELTIFSELFLDYPQGRICYHQQSDAILDPLGQLSGLRNREFEKSCEKDLLDLGFQKKILGDKIQYSLSQEQLEEALEILLEMDWRIEDAKGKKVCIFKDLSINIDRIEDRICVSGELDFSGKKTNLKGIVGEIFSTKSLFSLDDHNIAFLPKKLLRQYLEPLKKAEQGEDVFSFPANQIGTYTDLMDDRFSVHCQVELENTLQSLKNPRAIFDSGKGFLGTLRNYQKKGIQWLLSLYREGFHGILADEMGLGKTIQVIAFFTSISLHSSSLILCPKTLLFQWKKEFSRFAPHLKVFVYEGSKDHESLEWELNQADIVITSYSRLRIDQDFFQSYTFHCIILDEAHVIKNAHTQLAQAVFSLQSFFRLSLTGTPLENKHEDIWSQFHFLMPDLLGEKSDFLSSAFDEDIQNKVKPFILRRMKKDVLQELPEKLEEIVTLAMHPLQRELYDEFLGSCKSLVKRTQTLPKKPVQIFEALLRLRQICCHPKLLKDPRVLQDVSSSKIDFLLQEFDGLIQAGKKVVVYSQFTHFLKLISKDIAARGYLFAYLDGQSKDREKIISYFQETKNCHIFLLSLKAAGVGINLTCADVVYLCDPWWNDAVENQAIDRLHRMGKKGQVVAKRLICFDSIEEKIIELKKRKQGLVEFWLDSSSKTSLTMEDMEYLIGY